MRWELAPIFHKGDSVAFIGDDEDQKLFNLTYGEILTVTEDFDESEEWVKTRTSGMKPIQTPQSNLEVVEQIS